MPRSVFPEALENSTNRSIPEFLKEGKPLSVPPDSRVQKYRATGLQLRVKRYSALRRDADNRFHHAVAAGAHHFERSGGLFH